MRVAIQDFYAASSANHNGEGLNKEIHSTCVLGKRVPRFGATFSSISATAGTKRWGPFAEVVTDCATEIKFFVCGISVAINEPFGYTGAIHCYHNVEHLTPYTRHQN